MNLFIIASFLLAFPLTYNYNVRKKAKERGYTYDRRYYFTSFSKRYGCAPPVHAESILRRSCRSSSESSSWSDLPTTGFYVAGYAETDGPLGTEVLAQALKKLGYQPVIITDALCKDYFEPMGLEVEYVPFDADASFYQDLLLNRDPVGLISIERCGINSKNDYANMRGVSIRENTATIDQLFSLAHKKGLPTWGVGDGGNEIGMGNLKDVISKKLSLVPCVNKVDHLVIATVSNWHTAEV